MQYFSEIGKRLVNRVVVDRLLLLIVVLALGPTAIEAQRPAPRVASPSELAGQAIDAEQPAVYKSGIDLVSVSATVKDRRGRLVKGLSAKDFEVLDNGTPRAISEFRSEPSPVSLAVLFDISGSMRVADRVLAAKFAAHHLLAQLEPGRDEAALMTFDSRLHEVTPFTMDTGTLQGALGEINPFGATSLHDAIAEAARRTAARVGRRRAVVVLTDGVDTASGLTASQVSGIASVIDVPVYVIATVLPIDHQGRSGSLPRRAAESADGTVEHLAAWTGGTLLYASTPSDTSGAARQVVDELRQQYVLAFEPGAGAGWRPLEIRMKTRDYSVRARSGYMAGGPRG